MLRQQSSLAVMASPVHSNRTTDVSTRPKSSTRVTALKIKEGIKEEMKNAVSDLRQKEVTLMSDN